jgi:hypothetical protein
MTFHRVLLLLAALLIALTSAAPTSATSSSTDNEANVTFVSAAATASSASAASASAASASDSASVAETLAPIDTATGSSSTFQLVESQACNETVSDFIYVVYNKNRALFDRCVNDAQYQIFPFLGTHPSAAQVLAMASSDACVAVFTGVARADPPECDITDMPLKAAVETLLKIAVDLDQDLAESPTTERFLGMMYWRRDVNLAAAAGLPCDSESELYAEYAANLETALANTNIRVLEDYTIVYQLASGSWTSDGTTTFATLGSGSGDDVVGTVTAEDSDDAADSDNSDADVGDDSEADSSSGSNAGVSLMPWNSMASLVLLIAASVMA